MKINKKSILIAILMLLILLPGCSVKNQKNYNNVKRRIPEGVNAIALITDSGSIADYSFNQTAYEACKDFASKTGTLFVAKKPRENTDKSREDMVRLAIAEGYNIIVLPGYVFGNILVECSFDYPDVKFIALDVTEQDILTAARGSDYDPAVKADISKYYNRDNCYIITYREDIAGYMAGYAAVKMGYKHLGFMGGMEVPAVTSYGYGFIEGADKAAEEMNITDEVDIRYTYTGTFSPNVEITEFTKLWYKKGVEVIFSCGGGIYSSVAEACSVSEAKMIGVDVDQADVLNSYSEGMAVTSATKGLGVSVTDTISAILNGTFEEKAGKIDNLGLVNGVDLDKNYVQLAPNTQWTESFNENDYAKLVNSIMTGDYAVSNRIDKEPEVDIKLLFEKFG